MKDLHKIASEVICPVCRNQLSFNSIKSIYQCLENHNWEILSGIPRLVDKKNNYTSAFGLQWKRYRKTQLDSYSNTSISKKRLTNSFGKLYKMLEQEKEISVLEVGCGAGRFTEILLSNKNVNLTSIDFSNAVEANLENFRENERHTIIQCDINKNPFRKEQFDIVVCLGVVQHTTNPEITIKSIYDLVKPGGYLIFDHYTHSLSRYTKIGSGILRPIFKRLDPELAMKIIEKIVYILFPIHKLVRNIYFFQILLSRISPVRAYFRSYPELTDELHYEWALLDTHDTLTDYYKHLRSRSQLFNMLTDLAAINISINKGGNGLVCRAEKPISNT